MTVALVGHCGVEEAARGSEELMEWQGVVISMVFGRQRARHLLVGVKSRFKTSMGVSSLELNGRRAEPL